MLEDLNPFAKDAYIECYWTSHRKSEVHAVMNKIVSLLIPKLFMCPFIFLQFDEYVSKVTPASETHVQPQTQNNKVQGNGLEKMGCYSLDQVLLVAEAQ